MAVSRVMHGIINPVVARVAVLTVTYNSGAVLPDFLRSLSAQSGVDWRLFAVDNASTDSTVAQLRAFQSQQASQVTLLLNPQNLGAAEGNNQAIHAALDQGFDLLLFLNNDVSFPPDLLAQLVAGLAAHGCDIACPRISFADRPNILWAAGGEFQPLAGYRTVHYGIGQPDGSAFDQPRRITYAPTTCLLVTRRAIERAGELDPAYFAYSEDADFMFRAQRGGVAAWYVPQARLQHKVSALAGRESSFADYYGTRNRVYFLRKNIGGLRAAFWSSAYLLYCIARWTTRRDSSVRFKTKLKAWREGWQMRLPAK